MSCLKCEGELVILLIAKYKGDTITKAVSHWGGGAALSPIKAQIKVTKHQDDDIQVTHLAMVTRIC